MTEERFKEIENNIKEIKNALLGDGFGNHGYKHRLEKVESHVSSQKKKNWILEGIKVAILTIWGLIVVFWKELWNR